MIHSRRRNLYWGLGGQDEQNLQSLYRDLLYEVLFQI
nr:MAG TPA: hypothetical protein [Caudoviricetes sp.]